MDAPDSPLYTVRFLILTQQDDGWRISDHATRYRAVAAAKLTGSAVRAGLIDIGWLTATEADFHQPVIVAQRPR